MTNPEISLDEALKKAKKIVDTAFENYPDKAFYIDAESGQPIEEVIK